MTRSEQPKRLLRRGPPVGRCSVLRAVVLLVADVARGGVSIEGPAHPVEHRQNSSVYGSTTVASVVARMPATHPRESGPFLTSSNRATHIQERPGDRALHRGRGPSPLVHVLLPPRPPARRLARDAGAALRLQARTVRVLRPQPGAGRAPPQIQRALPHLNGTGPGQPAATVPAGFTEGALPVAMRIVGRRLGDALVLRSSAAFEAARPWKDHWPGLLKEANL